MIGLDSAASLSRESSSSLKLMLVSGSGSGAVSFCFPFETFFKPLFFFEIKFPAFVAMLCEAVVRAVTAVARVPPEDLVAIDSDPASEPESVV